MFIDKQNKLDYLISSLTVTKVFNRSKTIKCGLQGKIHNMQKG